MKKVTMILAILFMSMSVFGQVTPTPTPQTKSALTAAANGATAVVTTITAGAVNGAINVWNGFWAVITAMGQHPTEKVIFWIEKK